MKTSYIQHLKKGSFAFIALTLLMILGCEDREPEIEYNHGFTIDASTEKDTLSLQEKALLTVIITPNRVVTNTKYTVEYTVTKGEGVLQTMSDTIIPVAVPYALEIDVNNTQQFQFAPQSEGDITLALRIADNLGGAQEFELNYFVNDAPFSLSIAPKNTTIFEATTSDIILNLTQRDTIERIYQMKINNPLPEAIDNIADSEDAKLVVGEWYPITLGERILKLTTLSPGSYPLSITIKDNTGEERTQSETITIAAASFNAAFTDATIDMNTGETKTIQLSVTPQPENPNITYRAKLNTTSAIASFSMNGTPIQAETWFDVAVGQNEITLNALDTGVYTADFTVMASNDVTRDVSLPITVQAIPVVSNILSGRSNDGTLFKLYIKFDYTIDPSIGAATDPKEVEIKFILGGTERTVTLDFTTAPRHPSRAGYILIHEGDLNLTADVLTLGFYENSSSYEVKIITSNDIESKYTLANNSFRNYEFDETL